MVVADFFGGGGGGGGGGLTHSLGLEPYLIAL